MINIHQAIQKASKPLSSILKSGAMTQHSTLKTILKDVSAAHPDMTRSEHIRLSKTIKKMGDDPSSIASTKQKKIALRALDAAGHLKYKYAKHLGSAIRELDAHVISPQTESLSQLKAKSPSQLSKEERRSLKKKENQMKARAAAEREEAEGKLHAGKHKTTRLGLETMKKSHVSANQSQQRQSGYQLQDDDKNSSESQPDFVDMMID
jgi:hypothetical protein